MREQIRRTAVVVLLSACGPDPAVPPRSGVYDVSDEIVTNDCTRSFDDPARLVAVEFADDRLKLQFPDIAFLTPSHGWTQALVTPSFAYDGTDGSLEVPANDLFDTWYEYAGCRYRRAVVGQVLGEDVLSTRVTYEWEDAGRCTSLVAPNTGCKLVREYTYTLREACDGCSGDELEDRLRALFAQDQSR